MGCTVELLGTNGRQKPDRLVLRVCRGLQAGAFKQGPAMATSEHGEVE